MLASGLKITDSSKKKILINKLAEFEFDPLGFVYWAFPWDKEPLSEFGGPDEWQKEALTAIGEGILTLEEAVKLARASGHGIGKSAFVSWVILWAISTKAGTRGVVTANTDTQLKTKTWAELSKWHSLFIAKDLFTFTATAIHINHPDTKMQKSWRIDCIPWSESNPEAFAGLHNQGKRILVVFDEASAIHDKIWEVSEGALTDKDTQILWIALGNPTRNVGKFFDCFHKNKHRWNHKQIDSRTVKHTNKKQIQSWIEDNGENSDFVKIRVKGQFPSTSSMQFIPTDLVDDAFGKRLPQKAYQFAPVIIGVDPAYSGDDETVIYMRQGLASKLLAKYAKLEDDLKLAGYVAHYEDVYKADAVFVDMGYGTGVISAGKAMHRSWIMVPFGSKPNNIGYLNKRSEMWGLMKDWLKEGGSLAEDDTEISKELTAPEFVVRLDGKIAIEKKEDMKKRGFPSPNRADALCLTFAQPVRKKGSYLNRDLTSKDYDPFAGL